MQDKLVGAELASAQKVFVVDLGRCVGCAACVLACRLEHEGVRGPESGVRGPARRRVLPLNERRHPGGPTYFLSLACHHCERPACVDACPSGAYRRRADGLVVQDEASCVGCRYCEMRYYHRDISKDGNPKGDPGARDCGQRRSVFTKRIRVAGWCST